MPFELPLDAKAFRHALQAGLGRAVLDLRSRDVLPSSHMRALKSAVLTNQAYDWQIECDAPRADWLWPLVVEKGLDAKFAKDIVAAGRRQRPVRHAVHLETPLVTLARSGNAHARAAIYALAAAGSRRDIWPGLWSMVELDGLAGFMAVVRLVGSDTKTDDHWWRISQLNKHAGRRFGAARVRAALDAAKDEPAVARWLRLLRAKQQPIPSLVAYSRRQELLKNAATFEEAMEILQRKRVRLLSRASEIRTWSRHATFTALNQLKHQIPRLRDPLAISCALSCFDRDGLRTGYPDTVPFFNHANERVRLWACLVARRTPNRRTDDAALARIRRVGVDGDTLSVLRPSTMRRHAGELIEALARVSDSRRLHNACLALEGYAESAKRPHVELVVWMIEHTPCSFCRRHLIERLIETSQAPEWLLREAVWDADEETRHAAKKALKGVSPAKGARHTPSGRGAARRKTRSTRNG